MLVSTGVILNSLSSIISYNNFNVEQMFVQKQRQKTMQRHQPTFLKQFVYFIIMVSFNLW